MYQKKLLCLESKGIRKWKTEIPSYIYICIYVYIYIYIFIYIYIYIYQSMVMMGL